MTGNSPNHVFTIFCFAFSAEEGSKAREVYHGTECPKFNEQDAEAGKKPDELCDDTDAELTCLCSKSPPKMEGLEETDEAPGKTEQIQNKEVDPQPVVSQDLMDLSYNMECENKNKAETAKDAEQTESKLTNPLAASPPPRSPADGSEKTAKSTWYSQLSEIPHLPSQIDFSMFKTSRTEHSDSVCSDSSIDQQSASAESHKVRLLKRLSQPVSWIESFTSGSVDSAAEITATAQSTLSKILPRPFSSSSEKEDTPPTSASSQTRHFSSSPHSFVDFSSGLFAQDASNKVRDVSELSSTTSAGQSEFCCTLSDEPSTSVDKSNLLESTESADSAQSASRVFLSNDSAKSEASAVKKVQIKNIFEDNPNLFVSLDSKYHFTVFYYY